MSKYRYMGKGCDQCWRCRNRISAFRSSSRLYPICNETHKVMCEVYHRPCPSFRLAVEKPENEDNLQSLMRGLEQIVYSSGLSQREIAKISGVGEHTFHKWFENGGRSRTELLVALLNALGYELEIVKRSEKHGRS